MLASCSPLWSHVPMLLSTAEGTLGNTGLMRLILACLAAFPHVPLSSECRLSSTLFQVSSPLPKLFLLASSSHYFVLSSFSSSRRQHHLLLEISPDLALCYPPQAPYRSPQTTAKMPAGDTNLMVTYSRVRSQSGHWRYKSEKCMILILGGSQGSRKADD